MEIFVYCCFHRPPIGYRHSADRQRAGTRTCLLWNDSRSRCKNKNHIARQQYSLAKCKRLPALSERVQRTGPTGWNKRGGILWSPQRRKETFYRPNRWYRNTSIRNNIQCWRRTGKNWDHSPYRKNRVV